MQQQKNNKQRRQPTTDAYAKYLEQQAAAERIVVGAILLESEAVQRVAAILRPEHFASHALGIIYRTAYQLWTEGEPVDMLRVSQRLMKEEQLDEAGGAYALASLTAQVGTTTNLEHHALFVRQCYTQRQLLEAGGRIRRLAADVSVDVADAVQDSLRMIENVALDMDDDSPLSSMQEATDKALAQYDEKERLRRDGRTYGLPSGLRILDKYVGGFKPGELVVLGARPGMGKTSVMLHFARSMAWDGRQVCIFSLEMGDVSLANRLLLSEADIPADAFRLGRLTDEEKQKLYYAAGKVRLLPISIDETPHISVQQAKVRCMNIKRRQGLDCVMIDYLQLMDMRSENRSYNREQEIAQTTRRLKQMAKELGVPVILLSQLNRSSETKSGGRTVAAVPGLSDLRESGAIEQDADVVLLVHRPEYYDDPEAVKGVGIINIAKQRDGRTGKVKFAYNESLTRISDATDQGQCPF